MIVKNLYLVECDLKHGDNAAWNEPARLIVPADSEEDIEDTIRSNEEFSNVGTIHNIELLYQLVEGCGMNNGVWCEYEGLDNSLIYRI